MTQAMKTLNNIVFYFVLCILSFSLGRYCFPVQQYRMVQSRGSIAVFNATTGSVSITHVPYCLVWGWDYVNSESICTQETQ